MNAEERWVLEEKHGGQASPAYEADRRRLAGGEPAAYVIGNQPFLGLTIGLDSRPLIPRPETEWWTERLLDGLGSRSGLKFLDVCAGSGAIGCAALAWLPDARVSFGEIDPSHEATIRANIRANGLIEACADVRIGDLFEPFDDDEFDVVAANPPYVPSTRALPPSVADYEPVRAFYAGEDGLDVIRRIATGLRAHLAPGGVAWIECDRAHADAARELFAVEGFDAAVLPDQYDKPRVITVR